MILSLIRKDPDRAAAEALFTAISAQARQPAFYTGYAVEDSVEGRFELLILHVYLVLRRLKTIGRDADKLSQHLTDVCFSSLDAALREMGVGDLSVSKKIRKMAEALYGRIGAYEKSLTMESELAAALSRNVYNCAEAQGAVALARYVRQANDHLATQPGPRLRKGIVSFPLPEGTPS